MHLSSQKLYLYYTDMCQQEGGGVLDFRDFTKVLRHDLWFSQQSYFLKSSICFYHFALSLDIVY